MIQTILVPLDGSKVSENSIPLAIDLAQAYRAKIVLVCVTGNQTSLDQAFTEADRLAITEKYANVTEEEHLLSTEPHMVEHSQRQVRAIAAAEQYLSKVSASLVEQGVQAEMAVPYGSAIDGILTEIKLHSADLVVMAAHTHSVLGGILEKSVALGLLTHSRVPVLIVPTNSE